MTPPPTPDEASNGRALLIAVAVLCGLTAAFVWLVVTRVVAP